MLDLTPRILVKRAPTRWGSLEEQLTRFLEFQDVLLYMQSQECFAKCSTPVLVPTRATRITLQELVDRLRLLKIVGRLLEARNVFTLPHLPYLVSRLVNDCNKAVDSIDPGLTPPLIAVIRRKTLEFVQLRLGKHLNDATQPSLLSAILMPEYSYRLKELGVSDDTQKEILEK